MRATPTEAYQSHFVRAESKMRCVFLLLLTNFCVKYVKLAPSNLVNIDVCVPEEDCTSPKLDFNTSSPRQVTLCPSGFIVCLNRTVAFQCGLRRVNSSTENGPAEFGSYPWQAYIVNQTGYTGSGVLIDEHHILTVAHKFYRDINSSAAHIRVRMGVWSPTNLTKSGQSFGVEEIIIHPEFDNMTLRNDVALLRLKSPVTLDANVNIGTACLPPQDASYNGRNCSISGWGQSYFGANDASEGPQRQVTIPVVDYETCRASMGQLDILGDTVDKFLDPEGEICAGGQAHKDACTQDGGAPLVCQENSRFYVVGLVAWGVKCGISGVYGVYVNVPHYRSWIESVINP